ncbi:Uncharacterised protein [Bordetella pertussis]|nr:Uncharacterised protein [Bordetella pertussis]
MRTLLIVCTSPARLAAKVWPGSEPDGALLQVGGHERTRQLAQGLAGLAPRAGDADGFESHG